MANVSIFEQAGMMTASPVAKILGMSRATLILYVKDGRLPSATRITESGARLFDTAWLIEAKRRLGK